MLSLPRQMPTISPPVMTTPSQLPSSDADREHLATIQKYCA